MKRIKTKIKKFFGIDFTPRKALYAELISSYDEIDKNKIIAKEKENNFMKTISEKNKIILEYDKKVYNLNSIIEELKTKINEKSFEVKVENFKSEEETCLNEEYVPSDSEYYNTYNCDYDCSSVVTDECPLVCLADSCSYHCLIDWEDNYYNCSDDCEFVNCPCYTMGDYGLEECEDFFNEEYISSDIIDECDCDVEISFDVVVKK